MITKIGYVSIEISEQEAREFAYFRKYYLQFGKLLHAGIFELREGRAILDFDSGGNIQNIKKELNFHYS